MTLTISLTIWSPTSLMELRSQTKWKRSIKFTRQKLMTFWWTMPRFKSFVANPNRGNTKGISQISIVNPAISHSKPIKLAHSLMKTRFADHCAKIHACIEIRISCSTLTCKTSRLMKIWKKKTNKARLLSLKGTFRTREETYSSLSSRTNRTMAYSWTCIRRNTPKMTCCKTLWSVLKNWKKNPS